MGAKGIKGMHVAPSRAALEVTTPRQRPCVLLESRGLPGCRATGSFPPSGFRGKVASQSPWRLPVCPLPAGRQSQFAHPRRRVRRAAPRQYHGHLSGVFRMRRNLSWSSPFCNVGGALDASKAESLNPEAIPSCVFGLTPRLLIISILLIIKMSTEKITNEAIRQLFSWPHRQTIAYRDVQPCRLGYAAAPLPRH